MVDHESPSARTLLALAKRRAGIDAACCGAMFARLAADARIRRHLQDTLDRHALSDLQFAILVVLFESTPAMPMATLALRAAVSRSAVTDALDHLETRGFAKRTRDGHDRRVIRAQITETGRAAADQAINDYLHATMHAVPRNVPGLRGA